MNQPLVIRRQQLCVSKLKPVSPRPAVPRIVTLERGETGTGPPSSGAINFEDVIRLADWEPFVVISCVIIS